MIVIFVIKDLPLGLWRLRHEGRGDGALLWCLLEDAILEGDGLMSWGEDTDGLLFQIEVRKDRLSIVADLFATREDKELGTYMMNLIFSSISPFGTE